MKLFAYEQSCCDDKDNSNDLDIIKWLEDWMWVIEIISIWSFEEHCCDEYGLSYQQSYGLNKKRYASWLVNGLIQNKLHIDGYN